MMRLGSSEYARIRYLSAIIRDKIKAFVPKVEVKEVPKITTGVFELFEPIVEKQSTFEEQVLYDVEDDLI
jgi:hypothetical protein